MIATHHSPFISAFTALSTLLISSPVLGQDGVSRDDQAFDKAVAEVEHRRLLHGFRLGYLYVSHVDRPDESGRNLVDRYGIRSPHQFLVGYEVTWRMIGHDWLNVLLVGNLLIAGIEQSRFFPSGNAILGFEMVESFQVGVGANLTPTREKAAHMLIASGWTPRVGDFYVPVHAFFVPDVDKHHRLGVTVGVNF